MIETHGLDLEAIEKASNGHSIFAPSASAMWLLCSGSLIPNILAKDSAGEDAAYGTVGHEVGEAWLKEIERLHKLHPHLNREDLIDEAEPFELVGTIREVEEPDQTFSVLIDAPMVAYVREYVEWCVAMEGDHYTERRVDFSQLTPIPRQRGTADYSVCAWQVLTISDLKMGKGVQVFAAEDYDSPATLIRDQDGNVLRFNGNSQALLYALGFFFEWDWLYDFQRIVIRIGQPRLGHWDVWETTREELLAFAEWVKERALLAWSANAPRTPGTKQCRFCRVAGSCAAKLAWLDDLVDDAFDDLTVPAVYEAPRMVATAEAFVSNDLKLEPRDPGALSTEALAKLLPYRKMIENFFAKVEAELIRRSASEEIPGYKNVKSRTNRSWTNENAARKALVAEGVDMLDLFKTSMVSPAQADDLLKALGTKKKAREELLASLAFRPEGRPTLAPISDKRAALADPGDVFDDLSDEGL